MCLERSHFAATVQRQRFAADELDEVIEAVRGAGRTASRPRATLGLTE